MSLNSNRIVSLLWYIAPFILVMGGEGIVRKSPGGAFQWMIENPGAFFFNYLIAGLFLFLLSSLINNIYFCLGSYYFTGFLLVLLDSYKIKFLKEPIFPWDLLLFDQLIRLLPNIYKEVNLAFLFFLLFFFILIIFCGKNLPSIKMEKKHRVISGLLSVCLLLSIAFYNSTPIKYLIKNLKIQNIVWAQNENYKKNGFFLGFFMNFEAKAALQPNDTHEEQIQLIMNDLKKYTTAKPSETSVSTTKPNVVFVMNEAFSDPTQLKNVSFSSDPLPTFHSLLAKQKGRWMLSPVYGGGTANVEFEALTGLNMSFLPEGSIPYEQYIKKPFPSLASVLLGEGYHTLAIHPYTRTFWNRDKVYKNMGFEKFISLEQFVNPQKKGGYFVDDREVTELIMEETKKNEKPVFIYAITMQNHGTYFKSDHNYPSFPIKVDGNISKTAKETLEVYTNGAADGDQQIADLISFFKEIKEPTIFIFFGDHLPYLTVYNETDFVTPNKMKNMKTTPLVIWTNYGKEPKQYHQIVSSSFLGTYVFELSGLNTPLYYKFLSYYCDQYPALSNKMIIDAQGKVYTQMPQKDKKLQDQYQNLQYYLLTDWQKSKDK